MRFPIHFSFQKDFPDRFLNYGYAFSQFAVFLPGEAMALRPEIERKVNSLWKEFLVEEIDHSKKYTQAAYRLCPIAEYARPATEELRFLGRGFDEASAAALEKTSFAFIIDVSSRQEKIPPALRDAYDLTLAIAKDLGGFVWDEGSREIFTPEAWEIRRCQSVRQEPLCLSKHYGIHFYKDGRFYRLITVGLEKFGLPNIVVNRVNAKASEPAGDLINLIAIGLYKKEITSGGACLIELDRPGFAEAVKTLGLAVHENAVRQATVLLKAGKTEAGDTAGPLLEIGFPRRLLGSRQAAVYRGLGELFGYEDKVLQVGPSEELEAASARAKERLPELRERFRKGLEPGEILLLKMPFNTDSGSLEWMWVEVLSWQGESVSGVLTNTPEDVSKLSCGDKVQCRASDAFDYILRLADGSSEGNETSAIIEAQYAKQ